MSEEKKILRCKASLKKGDTTGWIVETNDASPECQSALEGIGKKMGTYGRKYLKKHIETSTPEVKKALEKSGLHD